MTLLLQGLQHVFPRRYAKLFPSLLQARLYQSNDIGSDLLCDTLACMLEQLRVRIYVSPPLYESTFQARRCFLGPKTHRNRPAHGLAILDVEAFSNFQVVPAYVWPRRPVSVLVGTKPLYLLNVHDPGRAHVVKIPAEIVAAEVDLSCLRVIPAAAHAATCFDCKEG